MKCMIEVGFSTPLEWDLVTRMLVTGTLTDTTVVDRDQFDMLLMAWRCLYAEIVHAHVERVNIRLHKALSRWVDMLISRAI